MPVIKDTKGNERFTYEEGDLHNQLQIKSRELGGLDLSFLDLTGIDLSFGSLVAANLEKTNFTGANLRGTNLISASLNRTNFTEANLDHACLISAIAYWADFTNASLKEASLQFSDLRTSIFTGASLVKANLSQALVEECTFSKAFLEDTILPIPSSFLMGIVYPNLIQISGVACTIEKWDAYFNEQKANPLMKPKLATYQAYRAFLLASQDPEQVERLSRFERLAL
jgi:hypothetical protein